MKTKELKLSTDTIGLLHDALQVRRDAWDTTARYLRGEDIGDATVEEEHDADDAQKMVDRYDAALADLQQADAEPDPEEAERHNDIRKLAKDEHEHEGELEFDEGAVVSEGDDNGAYVQCWKWIDFAGTKFEKETDDNN